MQTGAMAGNTRSSSSHAQLAAALRACRGAFAGVFLVSIIINVLYLTGSFFMLEVYDRVLPSQSLPTLVGLAVLVAVLYTFQGILDLIRGRVLVRIGAYLDEQLNGRVFEALTRLPLLAGSKGETMQPLRELEQVRSFMSGMGPAALFDLPWMPFYLMVCFFFHPLIGWTATLGALLLVSLALLTEVLTRQPTRAAAGFGAERQMLADASRRNAEVLGAMGMTGRVAERWAVKNAQYLESQRQAADIVGGIGATSKVLRMVLQSAVLGVGAYLVIRQEATAGIIIASAILAARALAPVELAIANWRGFVAARQSWRRLNELFAYLPAARERTALPPPRSTFTAENISAVPPGTGKLVVQDVAFRLQSGQGLGIVGPSGSGKSSLARLLVGVWLPARGKVRLDGAALEQWAPDALGAHIGYLPQSVELFAGTVAENISRFEADPPAEKVVAAARVAGVHELIVRLPEGYDTVISDYGGALSAGQRQRIALARAVYGDPFLVVLDEPNSNLDADGEAALTQAIMNVRRRGGIAIVIAHRPSAIAAVDTLLVMADGKMQAFGPKEEVLKRLTRAPAAPPPAPAPGPFKVVSENQAAS
jgi:ATP-binding cassette subfamily C protein